MRDCNPEVRIVLAYSGGLDTSVAIPWLRERHDADIIAVTMDLGQGRELESVRDRALAAGAVRAHVLDVREQFAADYILPALKADALYDDRCPMAKGLAQALVARTLVEIAHIEQATSVAHGCAGSGDAHVRIEAAVRALDPRLRIIAPAREWGMTRGEEIAYARDRGVPVLPTIERPSRAGANLWGRSIEYRAPDTSNVPSDEIYALTRSPSECPDEPACVEIAFERGRPTGINGVSMPPLDLIASLGTIAGAHGVGRIDLAGSRGAGLGSREIHEAPAAVVLHRAHRELQKLVTTLDVDRFARIVSLEYADLIHKGHWFTPLREALDGFVDEVQQRVTGVVRLRFFKGDCSVVARESHEASHDPAAGACHEGGAVRAVAEGVTSHS